MSDALNLQQRLTDHGLLMLDFGGIWGWLEECFDCRDITVSMVKYDGEPMNYRATTTYRGVRCASTAVGWGPWEALAHLAVTIAGMKHDPDLNDLDRLEAEFGPKEST